MALQHLVVFLQKPALRFGRKDSQCICHKMEITVSPPFVVSHHSLVADRNDEANVLGGRSCVVQYVVVLISRHPLLVGHFNQRVIDINDNRFAHSEGINRMKIDSAIAGSRLIKNLNKYNLTFS